MTLLEALKVAQEACYWEAENFGAEYTDEQIPFRYELLVDAAAVLARLEVEMPRLRAMAQELENFELRAILSRLESK